MTVAIIGSGTMGSGIAQVAATHGCKVKLYDTRSEALAKSETMLSDQLSKLVDKGKMESDEKHRILTNISYIASLNELSDSELVIEAIIENLDVKRKLFAELEQVVSPETILASNTSSLSIASIASACHKPERVIGIHFFNPAPLMKLVEVIPAIQTHTSVTERTIEIVSGWGKTVARCKDTPGFIVNRVARPFYSEALRIMEEGIADAQTIDEATKSQGGFRMGPFELMDFIGNDVNYAVTESVFTAFYFDPRYKPSLTQKRLTEAGYLGRKSGRGFYQYESGNLIKTDFHINQALQQSIFERILVMLINEAAEALYLNVAAAEAIDAAMMKGVNYPKGLLAWADEKGIDWVVQKLDDLYHEYHEDRYRCSVLLRIMSRDGKSFY